VVGGKYRLERLLGSGGMGEVYLAFHEQLGRRVALKVLKEEALREPELRGRFQREAMAAGRLANDHIARVFDIGTLENGAPFMVMEYLEGLDLAAYLKQRGALPVAEVLDLLWQVCAGITVAHAAGIVHRDLKPANLFLVPRPQGGFLLKILDFGIAKAPEMQGSIHTRLAAASGPAHPTSLTQTSMVLGSAKYMAPEQMESAKYVDNRADLWSIGVIGYRMLTARMPFEGSSFEALFVAMSAGVMVPLAQLRPDAPPALIAAIEGCLQPAREHRWNGVAALQTALAAAFQQSSLAALPAPPAALSAVPAHPPPASPPDRRWKMAVTALAGALVSLTALGAFLVLGRSARTAEFSVTLSLSDRHHVDPVALLPIVRAKAQEISPSASLLGISVPRARPGAVDLEADSIVFVYRTPGHPSPNVSFMARGDQLVWQPSGAFAASPSAEPRCSYAQAWRAVVAAGFPAGEAELVNYGMTAHEAWFFLWRSPAGVRGAQVSGATCAVGPAQ
jgi:serine/threonine-protein kinase